VTRRRRIRLRDRRPAVAEPAAGAAVSPVAAMADPALFGPMFGGASWAAWRAAVKAICGAPMDAAERAVFFACTGRSVAPDAPAREAWLVVGRRGGKSRVAALLAVCLACLRDYAAVLAPGERGVLMVIAQDRKQARVVFRYVSALLDAVPALAAMVARRTQDALYLRNRIVIEIHTASFRSTRGYTVVGAVLDEVAYWRDEASANPDAEIVGALRPAMATVPGALLVAISSPYARRGLLYETFRREWGHDRGVLVWRADTRTMNPTADAAVIARAREEDPARAAAEYGAEFRSDLEGYVTQEVLAACAVAGRRRLPPVPGVAYAAFCDLAGGGSGGDSLTLAIAHCERREDGAPVAVLDALYERRPPASPEGVVREMADALAAYGCAVVVGDRFAGEWPRERFAARGVLYEVSARTKHQVYRDALPALNSGRAELLDDARCLAQLGALERAARAGGRDAVDHPPGGHDDVANAAAGALLLALDAGARPAVALEPDEDERRQLRAFSREFGFALPADEANVVHADDDRLTRTYYPDDRGRMVPGW